MKFWFILSLYLPLAALDLSIQSGKEDNQNYSILHLKDTSPFSCKTTLNDFEQVDKIECLIPKKLKYALSPVNNSHFVVQQKASSKGTAIVITPKTKIALYPIGFDIRKDPQVYRSDELPVKHWMVIGYQEKVPMLPDVKKNPNALNLPIKLAKENYPYIGGLDLKGNPIKMQSVQDVNGYIDLKNAYEDKDYPKALFLAQNTLKKYPDTVFKNELLLYQIRALHHLEEPEKLLLLSKEFIRKYSSDPNIAEVLAYTGNAYSKIAQHIDSDYFFDRLFTEHIDSPYAAQGMYFKAQELERLGNSKKAAKYYREALLRTKDVDLASAAAFRLANIEIRGGHPANSKEYIDKIASVNPKYFSQVQKESLEMIDMLKEDKDPKSAAKITQSLIGAVEKKSVQHQMLLKNLGLLYAAANEKEKALEKFNEYEKVFPYGEGIAEVKRAKDGLFFETEAPKGDKAIKQYDELVERYGNDSIGQQALYKKAKLLFKEGKYQSVLDIESDLYRLNTKEFSDINTVISQSAIALTKEKLETGKCADAMLLHKMYRIKLMPKWDGLTFDCALKMGNFPVAKKIATPHLKAKTIEERQVWLLRMTKAHFALGEYKEAHKAGKELITLLEAQKNPPLNDIYRVMYDTAQRTGDDIGMITYIKGCEGAFGLDFADVERYSQMVSLGLKRKDEAMVQNYAQKVMELQRKTRTYTQSPFIEFTLAQSLMNQDKNKESLAILNGLSNRKLTDEKRSRQQYLIGSLLMKMGKNTDAKKAFNSSIKADPKSAWGKLAKEALGLL